MKKIKKMVFSFYVYLTSIVMLIGGVFAIYLSSLYGYSQWEIFQSQYWPSTTAIIEAIEYILTKNKDKTLFYTKIKYRYSVAHQAYRGEYQTGSTDTLGAQQKQWPVNSIGGTLNVAYQMSDPSVAFTRFDLLPWWLLAIKSIGCLLLSCLIFFVGCAMCLVMLGVVYKEPRASKRERANSQRICRENASARKKAQRNLRKKA